MNVVQLAEHVTSEGLPLRVDLKRGVIKDVKLLGPESKNGNDYAPHAIAKAVPLYEAARVYVDHAPKGRESETRSYADLLGSIKGVSVRAGGLFGDLHFNPRH